MYFKYMSDLPFCVVDNVASTYDEEIFYKGDQLWKRQYHSYISENIDSTIEHLCRHLDYLLDKAHGGDVYLYRPHDRSSVKINSKTKKVSSECEYRVIG